MRNPSRRLPRPVPAAPRSFIPSIFDLEPVERRVLMASVAGAFFQDLDGDGVRDAGEAGLPNWTVYLDENQNGTFDGTSTTLPSTDVPKTVPDPGTTFSNLDVSGVGAFAKVTVKLNISTTWAADIDVWLISPQGTRVELTTDNGGSADNYTDTVFDDDAPTAITSGTAPFTGTYRPEQPLSALIGQNANGQWRLEVADDLVSFSGTLNSWSLTFITGERSTVSGAAGTYSFPNVAAGTYDVRQVNQAGWNQTAPASGFHTLTLDATTNATNIDFGNRQPPGTIRGTVFSDYDSDGSKDANEPGLSGWTVYLDNDDDSQLDAGEPTVTTDAQGRYEFVNLAPRQYVVREVLQNGYVQTMPGSGGVILDSAPGGSGGDQNAPAPRRRASTTEIVVAFKGNIGKGALKKQVQADRNLANLVNYEPSRDLLNVNGLTLVEVKLRKGTDPARVVEQFKSLGKVKWAQPNYVYEGDPRELTPNDPQYGSQYHHPLMKNNLAWDITMGDPRVVIAVTDDGNDFEHQDLYLNIWINQNEIPASRRANLTDVNADGYISFEELNNPINMGTGKAVDVNSDGRISGSDLLAAMVKDGSGNDTGNGGWSDGVDQGANTFADDLVGRDFWSNDNNAVPPSGDTHGTHVTGIAVARTNNAVGVAGTAGRGTVMPIRFYSGGGGNTWTSTLVSNAYKYAADNGAKILSTSYNVDGFANDNIFAAALDYLYNAGVLHFNSAGNTSAANPARQKFDTSLYVVNTDAQDKKSSSSAWGWGVDLSAPGTNILSTYPNNTYQSISGTSMATPNAAGVAAMIWSLHPTWTREQVAAQLLGSADNIDALNPTYAGLMGAGRANSSRALTETIAPPRLKTLAGLPSEGGTTLTKPASFTLDVASVFDPATMSAGTFEMRGSGIDGVFNTGDDTLIPMNLVFGGASSAAFKVGTNRLFFSIPGPMGSDSYRFTFKSTATDPFGQALDGNGDGTAGDAFTRTFTISGVTNSYRVNLDANEVQDGVDFGNHDRVAPRVLSSSFAFATSPHTLVVQFSEDVSGTLSINDLALEHLTTSQTIDTSGYSIVYNDVTNTATIATTGVLADGNYRATLASAGIGDPSGNALDGDGNGTPGGDFAMDFFFLMGDANHDARVNLNDFNILAANFGQSPRDFTQADFNYDGRVNLEDFNILASRFGTALGGAGGGDAGNLPAPPVAGGTRSATSTSTVFGGARIGNAKLPARTTAGDLLDERKDRPTLV